MKKFFALAGSLLLLVANCIGQNIFHARPISDSCAKGLRVGGCSFQYCDKGIFLAETGRDLQCKDIAGSLNNKKEISLEDWHQLVSKYIRITSGSWTFKKNDQRIPNDSCAIGFYVSDKHYLKCDGGYFLEKSQGYEQVSAKDWDEQARCLAGDGNAKYSETSQAEHP